jgi:hypothetical protein
MKARNKQHIIIIIYKNIIIAVIIILIIPIHTTTAHLQNPVLVVARMLRRFVAENAADR